MNHKNTVTQTSDLSSGGYPAPDEYSDKLHNTQSHKLNDKPTNQWRKSFYSIPVLDDNHSTVYLSLITITVHYTCPSGWWSGVVVSALASINEVNQCRARLVLRWVTVSGFNSRWGTFISVCDQPPRSTQPGHPFVGKRNEYQPKGGDALWLGSKGKYGSCVGGR